MSAGAIFGEFPQRSSAGRCVHLLVSAEGGLATGGLTTKGALLLQHHLPVGIFEALQLRQERQAEQVFRQRLVGQHHGIDVAHHEAADIDHGNAGARRLDGAVGGGDGGVVIAARGAQPEPRRGAFVQRHEGCAGIDHETDTLAVDPALGQEMAPDVVGNAEAAGSRLADGFGGGLLYACIGERGSRRHLVGHLRHDGAEEGHQSREDHKITHDATPDRSQRVHHARRETATACGPRRVPF